jgi:hypothetical protein
MKNLILILSVFMFTSCNQDDDTPEPAPVATNPTTTTTNNSNFPANLIGLWDLDYNDLDGDINFYTGTGSKVEFTDTPFPNLPNGYYISYGVIGNFNHPSQHQWTYNTTNQLIDNMYAINNLTSSNLELQYLSYIHSYSKTNWIPTTITMEVEFSNDPTLQSGITKINWSISPLMADYEDVVPGQLIYSKTISYATAQALLLMPRTYPAGGFLATNVTVTKRFKVDNILIGTTTQVSTSGGPLTDVKTWSLNFSNL